MTHTESESTNQEAVSQPSEPNEDLGWEGYVAVPTRSSLVSQFLPNRPALRTGLAFSMVFTVGAVVGYSLAFLWEYAKHKQ